MQMKGPHVDRSGETYLIAIDNGTLDQGLYLYSFELGKLLRVREGISSNRPHRHHVRIPNLAKASLGYLLPSSWSFSWPCAPLLRGVSVRGHQWHSDVGLTA